LGALTRAAGNVSTAAARTAAHPDMPRKVRFNTRPERHDRLRLTQPAPWTGATTSGQYGKLSQEAMDDGKV